MKTLWLKIRQVLKAEYIFQAFLIFLSVFLATVVNNWNEKQKEKEKTSIFLENLAKQMQNNQKVIERAIPYHQLMGRTADSLFKTMSKKDLQTNLMDFGGMQKLPNWRGLGIVSVDNSVYESGLVGGTLNNIPIELLTKITKIQAFQTEYVRFSRLLSEKIIQYDTDTKIVELVIFMSILGNDMRNLDQELVRAYGQLITEIEKYQANH